MTISAKNVVEKRVNTYMNRKIIKTTKVTILYREYQGGAKMMRTIVNGNKTNTDNEDFKPIKRWLVRDYFEELFWKDND